MILLDSHEIRDANDAANDVGTNKLVTARRTKKEISISPVLAVVITDGRSTKNAWPILIVMIVACKLITDRKIGTTCASSVFDDCV